MSKVNWEEIAFKKVSEFKCGRQSDNEKKVKRDNIVIANVDLKGADNSHIKVYYLEKISDSENLVRVCDAITGNVFETPIECEGYENMFKRNISRYESKNNGNKVADGKITLLFGGLDAATKGEFREGGKKFCLAGSEIAQSPAGETFEKLDTLDEVPIKDLIKVAESLGECSAEMSAE